MLSKYKIETLEQAMILLQQGEWNRQKRPTPEQGSKGCRSHTLFQLTVECCQWDGTHTVCRFSSYLKKQRAKISLCDLAGSEMIDQEWYYQASRYKELISI